jgi:hypothetical protein
MTTRTRSVITQAAVSLSILTLCCAILPVHATAQNYMYGQAGLQAGTNPAGIVAADFNGDGKLDLAVSNQADNTVSVILTEPDGTFSPKVDYPVGNSPAQVVTADFNGDGIADLAVVNTGDSTVSLLFGTGGGTFATQTTFPTGNSPVAIAIGDFNGDGNIDLAIANQSDNTVTILLGNGKGSFTSQPPLSISGSPYYVLSGDVNNDGQADLLVLAATSSAESLFLMTSGANGSFTPSSIYTGNGASIANLTSGDFNNDGNLDVAFADSNSGSILILLGNGAGSFSTQTIPVTGPQGGGVGSSAQVVAAGDFNHDGKLDLAVSQTYFIAVYPGNGNGTLGTPQFGGVPSFTHLPLLVPADFNNDAQLDLAIALPDYNAALILLGNGDGTLASRADTTLAPSEGLGGAVVADLNNDGKPDIAVAQFNQPLQGSIQGFITTLLGNGGGSFQNPSSTQSADIGIDGMVSADFTGSGNADLATADVNADGGIAVFLGNGSGTFGSPIDSFMVGSGTPLNPGPLAAGDFNQDGKTDLIVASEDTGNNSSPLYVLLSQGDGMFTANFVYNLAYGFVPYVAVADFNQDGFLDLAVTTQNEVLIFLGTGNGTFQAPNAYTNTGQFTNSVAAGDFNGDGKIDIVVGTSGAILFFAGNGDGTFQSAVTTTASSLTLPVLFTGDFNDDGILDLVTDGPGLGQSILIGNGDGTFQAPVPFSPTYYPRTFAVGDMNGDGVVDLVQFSSSNPTLGASPPQTASVWLSTAVISFSASSLQFGAQNVGSSSPPQTIQLYNAGNASLSVANIATAGDFSQTNACQSAMAIEAGCSIQVTFTPTTNGPRNGSLTLTDNARPGTQTLVLSGWAGPPDFVASISPASITVQPGSSADYLLSVSSGDGFAGTVQASCSGAPSAATCTLSPQSVQVSANATAVLQVTVNTTAPSAASVARSFFVRRRSPTLTPSLIIPLGLLTVCVLACLPLPSKRRTAKLLPAIVFAFVLVACGGGASGGGGGGTIGPPPVTGTPSGSYTLTFTMTSGNSTHTTTANLVVQ